MVHVEPPRVGSLDFARFPEEDLFQQNHMVEALICPIEYIINERSLDEV